MIGLLLLLRQAALCGGRRSSGPCASRALIGCSHIRSHCRYDPSSRSACAWHHARGSGGEWRSPKEVGVWGLGSLGPWQAVGGLGPEGQGARGGDNAIGRTGDWVGLARLQRRLHALTACEVRAPGGAGGVCVRMLRALAGIRAPHTASSLDRTVDASLFFNLESLRQRERAPTAGPWPPGGCRQGHGGGGGGGGVASEAFCLASLSGGGGVFHDSWGTAAVAERRDADTQDYTIPFPPTAPPCVSCFLRACCPSQPEHGGSSRNRLASPVPSPCAPLPPGTLGLMQSEARQRAPVRRRSEARQRALLRRRDLMRQPSSRFAPRTPDLRHARVLRGALARARASQPLCSQADLPWWRRYGTGCRQNRKVERQSFFQPGRVQLQGAPLQVRGDAAGTVWRSVDFRLLV